jgi:hypothetical protein
MAAEFVDDLRLATDAEMSRSEDIAWTGREKESLLVQLFVTRDRWTSVAIKLCGEAGGGGEEGAESATASSATYNTYLVIFVSAVGVGVCCRYPIVSMVL